MANGEVPNPIEADDIARLGPDLGRLYHALWSDWASLVVKWQEYREAFGTSPDRIAILNRSAGLFFRIVQDTLWHDTLLHLCRLTDPPRSVGRSNLTIQALPSLITDPEVGAEVAALVERAVVATDFARDWRNRHLGHRDLALAMNEGAQPLADASRQHVVDALAAVHAVLNLLSQRFRQTDLAREVIVPGTGAIALLQLLSEGLTARETRRDRVRRGEVGPGDLRPPAV